MLKTKNLPALLDGSKMWALWILFTVIGLGLSSVFVVPIIFIIGTGNQTNDPYYGAGAIIGAIIGIVVGGCHWLILRLRFHHKGRWLGATTIGWIIFMTAFWALEEFSSGSLSPQLIAISAGVTIGLSQWLALRGEVKHAIWWVPTTIAGWVCAVLMILFVTNMPVSQITAFVASGIVLGMVTGIGFVYLFDQSSQPAFNAIMLSGFGLFVILATGLSMTMMYSQQRLILRNLTGSVNIVAFSPDGKLLASGSGLYDGSVKIWDVVNGHEISTFIGTEDDNSGVISMAFSPDGKTLASNSAFSSAILQNVPSGGYLREIDPPFDEYGEIRSIVFSPDGRLFLTAGGYDVGTIVEWDVATGRIVKTLRAYGEGPVDSVAFSPDGRLLASGGESYSVLIWDFATGRKLKSLSLPEDQYVVTSVAFSPDGHMLVSISDGRVSPLGKVTDGTIILWDVDSGKELHTLSSPGTTVVFSPNGKLLASGASDGTVKFWDVASGQLVETLRGHTDGVNSVAFSPDGRLLASGSDDSTIRIWEVSNLH